MYGAPSFSNAWAMVAASRESLTRDVTQPPKAASAHFSTWKAPFFKGNGDQVVCFSQLDPLRLLKWS